MSSEGGYGLHELLSSRRSVLDGIWFKFSPVAYTSKHMQWQGSLWFKKYQIDNYIVYASKGTFILGQLKTFVTDNYTCYAYDQVWYWTFDYIIDLQEWRYIINLSISNKISEPSESTLQF